MFYRLEKKGGGGQPIPPPPPELTEWNPVNNVHRASRKVTMGL